MASCRLDGHQDLQAHLQTCSDCAREWQALQAIHQLFCTGALPDAGRRLHPAHFELGCLTPEIDC
jgi:hypothetical protein